MPRVKTLKKSARGERRCNGCGRDIEPGEMYYTWSFRYGGRRNKCMTCGHPRPSELTQSRMSEVYAAQEEAEDMIADATSEAELEAAVESVATVATEVMDGYREAAEHFGGAGENAERADELEGYADELGSWSFDGDFPDPDGEMCPQCEGACTITTTCPGCDGHGITDESDPDESQCPKCDGDGEVETTCEQCNGEGTTTPDEDALEEALEEARQQARDAIAECPL